MKKLTLLLAFLLNFSYLCSSQDYLGKQKCDIRNLLEEQSPAITITEEPDSSLYLTCKNELLGIPFVYFFDSNYVCRKYIVLYNKQDGEDLSDYLNEMLTKIDYSSWLDETKDYLYTILQSNKFTVMSIEILKLPKNE